MTPLESLVLRYVSTHPNTRRKTVVDALGAGEWNTQRRVRQALDTLSALRVIQTHGDGKRNLRYAISKKEAPPCATQ